MSREDEILARLERIERRLEHAGFHIPCLRDVRPESYTDTISGFPNGFRRWVDERGNVLGYERDRR